MIKKIMEKVKEISHGRVLVELGTLYAMLAKFEEAGIWTMRLCKADYYVSVLFEFSNPVNTYAADMTNAVGLDLFEKYRDLPYVAVVSQEYLDSLK